MSISENDDNNNNPDANIKEQSPSIEEESPEGHEAIETDNLEKMILSTGIRVGTPVKTKFMASFIVKANPEGLYILDISKTLARVDVAAKFIGRANIAKVAVTSAGNTARLRSKSSVKLQAQLPFWPLHARHVYQPIASKLYGAGNRCCNRSSGRPAGCS